MNARVPLRLRRGACPGLSAPMPTGDGLLVRLVVGDAVPLDAFAALCAAARAHGNGTMEVTARGSLQVRGLTPLSAPLFASEAARLDIVDGVPVLTGPLRDDADAIIDANSLAAELRQAIAHAHLALGPKVLVIIDGGGSLHLDALSADIRLRVVGSASAPRLLVALGRLLAPSRQLPDPYVLTEPVSYGTAPLLPLPACGERVGVRGPFHDSERENLALRLAARPPHPARKSELTSPRKRGEVLASRTASLLPPPQEGGGSPVWLGVIAPERVVDVVLGLLREIAAHGPAARAADVIRAADFDATRSRFAIEPAAVPAPRPLAEMVGRHLLRDGSMALGVALPFGHAQADALAELAHLAAAHGVRAIRPAPDRALMLIGVSPPDADSLAAAAEQLGFVVAAGDPRRRIAACPGAPACASGHIEARRLAAALAPQLAGLREGIAVHVSGCAKGCAHPRPAALTVVGDAQGCGIIRNATARTIPRYHVAPGQLTAEVARTFAEGEADNG
jgi:precorrin-3B synthase